MLHRGRVLWATLLTAGLLCASPARATLSGAATLEAGPEYLGGECFASVAPSLSLDAGFLALRLDAPFRLRLNRSLARREGLLRGEDWDALSDAGRVLRRLDVNLGQRVFVAHLGALAHRTLGSGTIVDGFGNSLLPDLQPVGLDARLSVGPVAVQAVGSNVLGLDVTAVSVALEPLSFWGAPNDRLHLSLSGALDWEPQARSARRFGVFGASLDGAVLRTSAVKLAPYVDFNSTSRGGHGVHVGLLADLTVRALELSLRAEYRHTRAPYQPAYFDVAYALERAEALVEPAAPEGTSLAKADLPFGTNDSWRGEVRARVGPVSLAVNVADRGRDPYRARRVNDLAAVAQVETDKVDIAAFTALRQFDWGHNPARVLAMGEVRYRITPYLHAWTIAGRQYRLDGAEGPRAIWQIGGGVGGALGF